VKWFKKNFATTVILTLTIGVAILGNWKQWDTTNVVICILTGALTLYTWEQSGIFKKQIRLDLFDKRFEVYSQILNLFIIVQPKNELTYEQLFTYRAIVGKGEFLLKPELWRYIYDNITVKAAELYVLTEMRNNKQFQSDEELRDAAKNAHDIVMGFLEQPKELKRQFEEYLDFKEI